MGAVRRRYQIAGVASACLVCLAWLLVAWLPVSAQGGTILAVEPAELEVQPGQEFDLELAVYGVTNLYSVDVLILFDAACLEVIDRDTAMVGTQVAINSSFLKPEFVISNEVDNYLGEIEVAYNQLSPSPAASGDGKLFTIRMKALAPGTVYVKFSQVVLAREDSSRMPVGSRAAEVRIGAGAEAEPTPTETPLPTATATYTPVPAETPTSGPLITPLPEGATPTLEIPTGEAPGEPDVADATTTPEGTTFDSPLRTPETAAADDTFSSPLATPTATEPPGAATPEPTDAGTPTATASATPAKQALAAEGTPVGTPAAARIDPAAEAVQPNVYGSLSFIAAVVGIIILGFALFVVLPRGKKGRA